MGEYVKNSNGDWTAWNKDLGIFTVIRFNGDGTYTVRKTQRIDTVLDLNHVQATNGIRREAVRQIGRIPLVTMHDKILPMCGFDGVEYDQDKMRKVLNDSDFKRLKTDPGRV